MPHAYDFYSSAFGGAFTGPLRLYVSVGGMLRAWLSKLGADCKAALAMVAIHVVSIGIFVCFAELLEPLLSTKMTSPLLLKRDVSRLHSTPERLRP